MCDRAYGSATGALSQLARGDAGAWEGLVRLLYTDLHRVAATQLGRERPGQTLQPTDLVHEAYVRLSAYRNKSWENRTHFFACAARVMRRILVDRARRKRLREDCSPEIALNGNGLGLTGAPVDLLDLDRALDELALLEQRLCDVVELRYFGGLTVEEAAEALQVSPKTVKRDWSVARAFLHGRLKQQ
jgi:RNA polymerase sigma-70 factor (ECF subfamily)